MNFRRPKSQAKTQLSNMRMFVINCNGTGGIITIHLASQWFSGMCFERGQALKTPIAVGSVVFAALALNSLPVRPSGLLDSRQQRLACGGRASDKAAWSPACLSALAPQDS